MLKFVLPRLLWAVPNIIILTLLLFLTLTVLLGSPAAMMLQLEASRAALAATEHAQGFDKPVLVQYGRWLLAALHGDLGRSFASGQTVASLIADAIPITLELALWSILLSALGAVMLNTLAARTAVASGLLSAISVVSVTIPNFVLGAALVLLFSVLLGWLPTSAWVPWSDGIWPHIQHLILPVLTLSAFYFGSFSMMFQAEYRAIEDQLFVRVARAKGLSDVTVSFRHIMPNAVLPMIAYVGICLGQLVGGAVVTEVIFSLPGIGRVFVTAIKGKDYPVVLAIGTLVLLGMVIANLVADIVLARLSPTVRAS
jgi:peptide/nickel transport system permease protein